MKAIYNIPTISLYLNDDNSIFKNKKDINSKDQTNVPEPKEKIRNNLVKNNLFTNGDFNFQTHFDENSKYSLSNITLGSSFLDYVQIKNAYINTENKKKCDFFYEQIYISINNDDFEYGMASKTESILRKFLVENKSAAKEALQEIWIKNFSANEIACGLLRVISHFDYHELEPQNILIATSAVSHKDDDVVECAIRCCENWGDIDLLNILQSINCRADWMNDYLNEVITNISRKST